MAAYMRRVICLVSTERNAFLTRGSGVAVESKRYVRGLRRKPVRVLFPESETGKVLKPPPQSQPAELNVKREKKPKVTSATRHPEERDSVSVQWAIKHAQVSVAKDHIDGFRFERALPGDKRLA